MVSKLAEVAKKLFMKKTFPKNVIFFFDDLWFLQIG